ncbi:TolC family protein [Rhodopseudomonas boonkerdii]|uniref:TolC family protein n=1 Tax=Nitrobacteraceae TaxID=41294 RepID=UPI000929127F|nr:TolC family protein [Rhodopseudomonas boonkerdii]MBN9584296.1 TolC family protein [Afipia sp.]OJU18469.1 MAG: transporter [Afipia sp. 62-7]OYU88984.1 MAG: transporter [Bradyrhizobiaceae bacterium PARB1]UGV24655.1 TolC family protein [Rhodopseudomonas boonkerdii]
MTAAASIARFAIVGATTALLWSYPAAAAERNELGATVESVVAFARRLNPTVAAASLDFDAAVHRIGTMGVVADPTLILEAWDVNRQGVGQRRVGFDQEIKLWGKYGLERDIARSDADAAKFQGRATVIELVAQVVAAHGEYNAAYEAIGIATDIRRRYDEILGLLRSRYGTTSVDRQDVIKAEIEAASAEGDLVRRQGELKSAAARLNALIGRPSLAPLAAPTGFRMLKVVGLAQVQTLGRSANPMLALAGAQSSAAAQAKSLTDLNYYPDVNVGAKYVQRPAAESTGEFTLGVKLPLHYDVKDAEQRAAGARLSAAQARNEALRLRIDGQIADAWFGVDALRKVVQIYASRQLPPARSSVENARNGFQAGSSDLSLLFDSERRFRAVQLDLLKLKVELQSKYAELERLAGGSL